MKVTRLGAAPVRQAEVPRRAKAVVALALVGGVTGLAPKWLSYVRVLD
jgi:hypothetical protein